MSLKLAVIFVVWKNTLLSEGLCPENCVDPRSRLGVGAASRGGGSSRESLSFGCRKRHQDETSGITCAGCFPPRHVWGLGCRQDTAGLLVPRSAGSRAGVQGWVKAEAVGVPGGDGSPDQPGQRGGFQTKALPALGKIPAGMFSWGLPRVPSAEAADALR